MILVVLPGGVRANPPIPAPIQNPNPSSPSAINAAAIAKSDPGQSGTVSQLVSIGNFSWTTFNNPNWQLTDQYEPLTDQYLTAFNGAFWINKTVGCTGAASCPVTYNVLAASTNTWHSQTFSQAPLNFYVAYSVLSLYVNWTHLNNLPNQPGFEVTRLGNWGAGNFYNWVPQGSKALVFANFTAEGWMRFGSAYVPSFFADNQLTWWVPYPAGNWYQPLTTAQSVNFGTTYPQSDYAILSSAFLFQWGTFPSDGNSYFGYEFLFTLFTQSGGNSNGTNNNTIPPCTGCGGSNPNPNSTGSPPSTTVTVSELVLQLGNTTLLSSGIWQESVVWTNLFPYNFTGEYFLESPALSTAVNVSLYVNGVPQPGFDYGIGATIVTLFSGVTTVATGTSVSFTIQYAIKSTFSFYGTLFYLGSTAVTIWNVVAVGGLVMVAFVIWWDFRNPERSRLQDGLLGSGLFVLFALAIVTL